MRFLDLYLVAFKFSSCVLYDMCDIVSAILIVTEKLLSNFEPKSEYLIWEKFQVNDY